MCLTPEVAATITAARALFQTALSGASAEECTAATRQLVDVVKQLGVPTAMQTLDLVRALSDALNNNGKAGGQTRERSLVIITQLLRETGAASEPFIMPLLSTVLGLLGDKLKPVQNAAQEALNVFTPLLNHNAVKLVLPQLLQQSTKWQANEARLNLVSALALAAPTQMARCLTDAIPSVAADIADLKAQVAQAARTALEELCNCCHNADVEPFIPSLMIAMQNRDEVTECVYKLASTTFVQTVDKAALAVISPVLVRGFAERITAVKRQSARIVENMSKLVDEPADLAPFLPKLLPLLEELKDSIADPECREVCSKAHETLLRRSDMSKSHAGSLTEIATMLPIVNKAVQAAQASAVNAANAPVLEYVANLCICLNDIKNFDQDAWKTTLRPYFSSFMSVEASDAAAAAILADVVKDHEPAAEAEVEDDAEELCNCNFSLAYGNKILLNNTFLKLKRGYRYGLVGKNDSGKTSLMRAIADNRVEGFPPAHELRTVFVATDIQGELSDLSVLDYIFADPLLKDCGVPRDQMAVVLNSVGFTEGSPANIDTPVGALSGGWKMKLALARAMLLKADILLLDEPTNHLDAYNVAWVENYLKSLVGVTCIMVSHDSGLLDRVCTHIIQIDQLKLHVHKGNLSEFVAKFPEAKSYFELKTDKFRFSFPKPGNLPGVTSKGKAILKMANITFTYPGAPKPQLRNVSVQVSLSSRVACVGVNGAGKSTMIKLLTGELEADAGSGDVWKHPNCRVAYVAQHAFHHIENHLEKTANEYIRWRYQNGNDREALQKKTRMVTPEEERKMLEPIMAEFVDADGNVKRERAQIRRLTEGRRQLRKDVEYEVEYVGKTGTHWVTQPVLEASGWEKVLKQIDEAIALRATMYSRPLTAVNVEKHLEDVGLEREFGTHTRIGALSGGQKVKVVLAAALWNCPHVLILDEPTNYLDRDSLAALAGAIREFEGGVVMITHNSQFCNDLCPEVWHLENNTLNVKGDAEWMAAAQNAKVEVEKIEEMVDAFGNTVKIKAAKKELTRAEKKEKERLKKLAKRQGVKYESDEEDW